jgi:Glycosyltransferase family 9 (heptosyltransferase)
MIPSSLWASFENYCCYTDRPCSKITNCLAEVFGLNYDLALGRYEIRLSAATRERAQAYYRSIGASHIGGEKWRVVVMHGEGNTSSFKKNLKQFQIQSMLEFVRQSGRIPVLLDWDNRSPLPDQKTIFCPRPAKDDIWGGFGSGDAEMIAALIHCAEAFVGIDSGPGKCASATNTPTLICWMGHHPIQFHDPADNTIHLIPKDWRNISPANHAGVADWFVRHYQFRTYDGEWGLPEEGKRWLGEVLNYTPTEGVKEVVPFVLPQGIGDCMWALMKIRDIAAGKPIDIVLTGDPRKEIDQRAVPFLRRFKFINSVNILDIPILKDGLKNDEKGRYRYVEDGKLAGYHFLMPNRVLEAGERLETWLPEFPVRWDTIDEFDWSGTERGVEIADALNPFAIFYLGPEEGHTKEGHNWGWLWEPKHWIELGKRLVDKGLNIAVVGAPYDRSFWENYVKTGVVQAGMSWIDTIGRMEIGETLALIKRAKVMVSYQCGLGILAQYMGVPTVMFWRPDGKSAHPERKVCFAEAMKDSWTRPEFQDRYMGCVYEKENTDDIFRRIEQWLTGKA